MSTLAELDDGHCDQSKWIALLDLQIQKLNKKLTLILKHLNIKIIEEK